MRREVGLGPLQLLKPPSLPSLLETVELLQAQVEELQRQLEELKLSPPRSQGERRSARAAHSESCLQELQNSLR